MIACGNIVITTNRNVVCLQPEFCQRAYEGYFGISSNFCRIKNVPQILARGALTGGLNASTDAISDEKMLQWLYTAAFNPRKPGL